MSRRWTSWSPRCKESWRWVAVSVSDELLSIMVCPGCRSRLQDMGETLRCTGCGLQYPIHEGVPVMLPEEAIPPEDRS